MYQTNRLIFLSEKSNEDLNNLWRNCLDGQENFDHINAYVPYPIPNKLVLNNFLKLHKNNSWLIKRKSENDIIGFVIHGDFIPGICNAIGFNIGLNYCRKGYATESLNELIRYLKYKGFTETFGYCYISNIGSIKTMEKCGFQQLGFIDSMTLKFRKQL